MGGVWGAGGEEAREPEPPAATWGGQDLGAGAAAGRVGPGEPGGGGGRFAAGRPLASSGAQLHLLPKGLCYGFGSVAGSAGEEPA